MSEQQNIAGETEDVTPSEGTCEVIVVAKSSMVRNVIVGILTELKFQHIVPVATCQDALHILEVEQPNWLITPLQLDEKVNALSLLHIMTDQPHLKHLKLSVFVDVETEKPYLPFAFELGLHSWHPKDYARDDLIQTFTNLISQESFLGNSRVRVAAEYAREVLTDSGLHKSRLNLEENLIRMFPGDPRTLLFLSEAELLMGNTDRGQQALIEVVLIDPKFKSSCDSIRKRFGVDDNEREGSTVCSTNPLGIDLAIVVEPDTDNLGFIQKTLAELGAKILETPPHYVPRLTISKVA